MKRPTTATTAATLIGSDQRMRSTKAKELVAPVAKRSPASAGRDSEPKRRRSAAVDIAASRDRRSRPSSVAVLARQTRVEVDQRDGVKRLIARFPIPLEDDQEVDITFLLALPNLWEMMAEGFRVWGSGVARTTRYVRAGTLHLGIVSYLLERSPTAGPADLGVHWTSFKSWLDHYVTSDDASVLSPPTCKERYSALRPLLHCLLDHPFWGDTAAKALDEYPVNQYRNSGRHSQPRQRLPRDVLERIDAAAQRELIAIRDRLNEGQRLIADGTRLLLRGTPDYKNFSVVLARLAYLYPTMIPHQDQVRATDSKLAHWLYLPKSRGGHGVTKVGSYLYASSRDLVPFVLLITIDGLLNPDSVLTMTWPMITEWDRAGEPCYRVTASKPRAGHDPSKFVDPALYTTWIDTLKRATERIRSDLPLHARDRLFVFAQLWGEARTGSYFNSATSSTASSDPAWKLALKRFQELNGLPYFNLSQLRPTGADEIGIRWGSQAAQTALEHEEWRTTERSYAKSGTRDRERESLGTVVQTYERFIGTSGRSDVRRLRITPTMDKGSATPGYACLDPYDSPRPGQRKERLCSAYGECPACPLAGFDDKNPLAVASAVALRTAIHGAQRDIAPQAWLLRWVPVLKSLEGQLSTVTSEVAHRAALFKIRLPTVG
jgi:hypothetical protein